MSRDSQEKNAHFSEKAAARTDGPPARADFAAAQRVVDLPLSGLLRGFTASAVPYSGRHRQARSARQRATSEAKGS